MHQVPQIKRFEHPYQPSLSGDRIDCDWEMLRTQLLYKWPLLTSAEVDNAGPNRQRIARLVERKYGVASLCIENYLRNFENPVPL